MSTVEVNKLKKPGSSAGVDELDVDYVVHGSCKAYGLFNQIAATPYGQSLNISSYADTGTGNSRFNLTNAMAGAGSIACSSVDCYPFKTWFRTVSQFECGAVNAGGSYQDTTRAGGAGFGDLA